MALKGARELVYLISTGLQEDGKSKTGTFKMTTKNKRKNVGGKKEKVARKCFDQLAWNEQTGKRGKHVLFEEGKL